MPHLKYFDTKTEELKNGWRPFLVSFINSQGKRVVLDGTLNEAFSYMVEGCITDGRANVKHQQHAPSALIALKNIPDEIEFTADHVTYDADGSINDNETIPVFSVTAGDLKAYAQAVTEWASPAKVLNPIPSLPSELVGEKKSRSKTRSISPLEF